MRLCKKCGHEKPLAAFNLNRKHWHRWSCKECDKAAARASTKKYATKPGNRFRNHLKTRYGITPAQYEALLVTQDGVCAICQNPPITKRLAVDHCHETGRVRGLLCNPCNRGIGYLKDSTKLAQRAAEYLS